MAPWLDDLFKFVQINRHLSSFPDTLMHESGQIEGPRWGSALIRALILSTLVQMVATAAALALTAMAPIVAADLGIGAYWIGYQVSLVYFSGAVASATAGMMVRRYGPVAIEQIALATFALGFLGLAGGRLATILVGSLAIGVGYGFNNPAASHILNEVAPPAARNLVYSIKQAGVPIGAVAASLLFPPLAEVIGWRIAYLIAVAAPLALIVASRLGRHEIASERDAGASFLASFAHEQRLLWKSPPLRALAMIGLLFSVVQLSLSAFAVVLLAHDAGWTLLAAGSAAALMQAGGAIGRVVWGVVADRTGAGFLILALLG
jgi:MFS family permease